MYWNSVKIRMLFIKKLCYNCPINKPFYQTIWNDINGLIKSGKLHSHSLKWHFGQLGEWIFCVLLAARICKFWRNMLSWIWQSIRCHFKYSVNTLIKTLPNASVLTSEDCFRLGVLTGTGVVSCGLRRWSRQWGWTTGSWFTPSGRRLSPRSSSTI